MNRVLPIILGTIALASTTIGQPANAFVTSKQLLTWCQSNHETHQATCLGYLLALDTYLQFAPDASKTRVCVSAGTSSQDLKDLVVMALQSVRHRQGENASALVVEALSRAFPCPTSFKGRKRQSRAEARN